jgi:predicted nucleotidyltransferase
MSRNEILSLLRTYKKQYADKYGIQSLGVFGSVARDQSGDNSDLDICVTTTTGCCPNHFKILTPEIAGSLL